jgi:muramoyltetrapeptide carboxypeptidase
MQMVGAWSDGLDEYTAPFVKSILFGEPVEFVNPEGSPITTVVPGTAEGRLCGGNLSLLAASLGTPYEIDTKGKILFIEEVGELPYAVDGMLTQLRNGGKFDDAAGIILGGFTNCGEKEGSLSGLSLEEIFQELIAPAGKPTISGVVCGHCSPSMSLPMGRLFKMDAAAGTFGPVET